MNMAENKRCLVFTLFWGFSMAQFAGMFSNMMAGRAGGGGVGGSAALAQTGSNCTATISCYPWCARQLDSATGCVKCQCSNSGSQMSGINPMNAMNPMSHQGLSNPMAQMFSGLNGGPSPMMGGVSPMRTPHKGCGPSPTTCPVPQPWCERIVGKDGCVRCICGKDLLSYVGSLSAQSSSTSASPSVAMTTATSGTTQASSKSTADTTQASLTTIAPKQTTVTDSCVTRFYCTKLCSHGYKTDSTGCPQCECILGGLIDTPVIATDSPGKHSQRPPTPAAHVPIVTGNVTSCPGIFDCVLPCSNGFKTDALGCPLCICES